MPKFAKYVGYIHIQVKDTTNCSKYIIIVHEVSNVAGNWIQIIIFYKGFRPLTLYVACTYIHRWNF